MRRFRSFVVDEARRQVLRDGRALHLTPKAFDALMLLLEAAPRVVRKSELHDRLWPNGIVSDASLVGLVGEIRRALGDQDATERIIRAVPRVGYAFDAPVSTEDASRATGEDGNTVAVALKPRFSQHTTSVYLNTVPPRFWIGTAAALVLVIVGVWSSNGREGSVGPPSEYEQLTNLADDSAVAPALSPDGRMVTFKVGESFFASPGQIYVKRLPDGDSVPLTPGLALRYGPAFTPDGARVTYTEIKAEPPKLWWDTYSVAVLGGEPTRLLPNASGLTWIDDHRVLFAEIDAGLHMGIVSSSESRAERHDIYWPAHALGMAHYAWTSPDRRWVLVVEMDQSHAWGQPCRLVPFDGSSVGRAVGPQGACMAAGWSPDGRWMFFGANVRGGSHLWRQRFPDGEPEQLTFGPTEEEGLAVAPDGRSVVTALGIRRSSIWVHDRDGERPIVTEGYSSEARLSADGTRIYYLLKPHSTALVSVLKVLDLTSRRMDTVLSSAPIVDYDVSRDGMEVAYTIRDDTGEFQVWHSSVNRRTPPRLIARNADEVSFGPARDIIFRSLEGTANEVVRASVDGDALPQRLDAPLVHRKGDVSPDGQWVIVASPGAHETSTFAVPLRGGPPRIICSVYCRAGWSADGRFFNVQVGPPLKSTWGTLAFPVLEGDSLPELPAQGLNAALPYTQFDLKGVHVINEGLIAPGSDPSRYVFTKIEFHRDLFRIPIR